ncbi:MAG: DUF1501 domain-containing protein [Bryobacteraceae bacterium]
MSERDKYERFVKNHPHHHYTFFNRPHFTRRRFFEIVGSGVVGSYLVGNAKAAQITTQSQQTKNTAKNCIFILLTGAISHTDSFDVKMVNGTTPSNFNPATVNGISWPTGLFPKMAQQLPNMTIVRSMQAHALVHTLAQAWSQIGRNPAAALGDIAPNIGSVVAIEKASERQPGQVFPTFLALNSPSGVGQGYFPATYAPFRLNQPTSAALSGVPNTTNPLGQPRLNTLLTRLHQIDDPLRVNSPYSTDMQDYDEFYSAAKNLTYNPVVSQAFSFNTADSMRYGSTSFGNSCLVAKQVLASNQGTRFIQISFGSWDMHIDIYGQQNPKGNNMYTMGTPLDNGVGALLADLQSSGLLNDTLVVMVGEFGRTVGGVTAAGGRDHWLQQSAVFAGGGVQGGVTHGATDPTGAMTTDFGWSRGRVVYPEDIEATIYSAMGIDWTTIRYDDPFGRGFEYVPFSEQDLYGPVNELWGS